MEVDVELADGSLGRAAVPAARAPASMKRGNCMTKTSQNTSARGCCKLSIMSTTRFVMSFVEWMPSIRLRLDQRMIELDGTPNKKKLGANAILGVSLATAHAAVILWIFRCFVIWGGGGRVIPAPMMNILNGASMPTIKWTCKSLW